jgi:hypothetical protein
VSRRSVVKDGAVKACIYTRTGKPQLNVIAASCRPLDDFGYVDVTLFEYVGMRI